MRAPQSCFDSGSRKIVVAFRFPPPQPGLSSRSSGRAMQTMRIGTSRDHSATCSIKSRNVGSAQLRSSKPTMRGFRRASASKSLRIPQKPSSADVVVPSGPSRPAMRVAARSAASSRPNTETIFLCTSSDESPSSIGVGDPGSEHWAEFLAARRRQIVGQIVSPHCRSGPRDQGHADTDVPDPVICRQVRNQGNHERLHGQARWPCSRNGQPRSDRPPDSRAASCW